MRRRSVLARGAQAMAAVVLAACARPPQAPASPRGRAAAIPTEVVGQPGSRRERAARAARPARVLRTTPLPAALRITDDTGRPCPDWTFFTDRPEGRLLIAAGGTVGDLVGLYWLQRASLTAALPPEDLARLRLRVAVPLLDVGFPGPRLYSYSGDNSNGHLLVSSLTGDRFETLDEVWRVNLLAVRRREGLTYRETNVSGHDIYEEPHIAAYDGDVQLWRRRLPRYPTRLLYIPRSDGVYAAYPDRLLRPGGGWIRLPAAPPAPDAGWGEPADLQYCLALDALQTAVYFAERGARIIYRVRLCDGRVLGCRSVRFTPAALALDPSGSPLWAIDDAGRKLVGIDPF